MNSRTIKTWAWVHKWSSLVCTVFMLLLCITGLPLIFHHEIGHLLGTEVEAPKMPADTPRISLDRVLEIAKSRHPDRVVQFASRPEDDDGLWFVTLTPTPAPTDDFKSVAVDARTGDVLAQPKFDEGFMYVMFKLHVDLFAGLPGKLFLGFMGLLLLVAIVSGVVLYSPFMRKLDFGTVRRDKRPRLKWLDLHNLLGVVTLVWLFVVGSTGMINTWADLLIKYWQYDQLSTLLAPYKNEPVVAVSERGSMQRSMEAALQRAPGMKLSFIAFPGTSFSSPHHNTFFMPSRCWSTPRPPRSRRRPGCPGISRRCWCRSRCTSATTAACRCRSSGRCWTSRPSSCWAAACTCGSSAATRPPRPRRNSSSSRSNPIRLRP